jgi:hypothetical protein
MKQSERLSECTQAPWKSTSARKGLVQFPASEKEKELVHEQVRKLCASISDATMRAEALCETLKENFLAIDIEYRKEILNEMRILDAYIWELNIKFHRMREHKERIISSPE